MAIASDLSISPTEAAELLGTSRASVYRFRLEMTGERPVRKSKKDSKSPNDDMKHQPMEATGTENDMIVTTGDLTQPIDLDEPITAETGWAPVLRKLGFGDPENWTIVGEVRIATWSTSKRTDDGDRDVHNNYSYRARIVRKTEEDFLSEADLDDAVKRMKTKRYVVKRNNKTVSKRPVGYCHHQGDEQAGKDKNNDGLALLEMQETEVLQASIDAITGYLKSGVNVTEILDNAAGDRIENVFGHYASQNRTTETMRKQINYAVESDIARTEAFAAFGLPITKVYTPSNHGEMRNATGGPHQSSESDNWDLIIAEQVKRVIDRSPMADQVTWHIPHGEPITLLNFMGVNVAAAHGHKADGKNLHNWVKGQQGEYAVHRDPRTGERFVMDIILLGHRHHFQIEEVNGTVLLQTGSLDQGSPYFQYAYGERAKGGALGFLIGDGYKGMVNNMNFL